MPCPFPGMDPYIERPEIWPDFHNGLITSICGQLQPLLLPKYAAMMEDRLYVVESERAIRPDLSVVRTRVEAASGMAAVAAVEPDPATVFELSREEFREPLIHIIEPAQGNRIVTAIELLSPGNKRPGPGRVAYLQKRDELWDARANLVEIDLLRAGDPTVRVSKEKLRRLQPWHYLAVVTRAFPTRQEVYPVVLTKSLPKIAIPLSPDDRDIVLDLQRAFERCYAERAYPVVLNYDRDPPGPLTPEETQLCVRIARGSLGTS